MHYSQTDVSNATILMVDDNPPTVYALMGILSKHGYNVRLVTDGPSALTLVRSTPPDLILLDINMPEMDGYTVCEQLKADKLTRDIPVLFISALDDISDKIEGFEAGGVDYITKPFQMKEVLARVKTHLTLHYLRHYLEELVRERTVELERALAEVQRLTDQLQAENLSLRETIRLDSNFGEIIGQSEILKYLLFRVKQVALTDTTVLISGETGTGKELIAHAIHAASSRSERPMVKVDCAALSSNLIESELFGHEKGAFTGAAAQRIGRFELAETATIFLDEIGELPLELQSKLLRVIQDGEFERLGSSRTRKVDVRIIAATNRDLEEEVRLGRFRQDLYYRLNVYSLSLPPLRKRVEDIPLLVRAFVQKYNKKLGKQIETIPQKTLDVLQQYHWPGNVRELENVIERAVIISQGRELHVELTQSSDSMDGSDETLEAVERAHILRMLEKTHWTIEGKHGAALILGLNPSTLRARMRKLDIKRPVRV